MSAFSYTKFTSFHQFLQHFDGLSDWADGANDASLPRQGRVGIDVQQAHMLQRRRGIGSVQLLGMDLQTAIFRQTHGAAFEQSGFQLDLD